MSPSKRGSATTAEPVEAEAPAATPPAIPEPGKLVPADFYRVPSDAEFSETTGMALHYAAEDGYQHADNARILREEFEFIPAPGIERIAEAMIRVFPEFEHLRRRKVLYLWARKTLGRKHPLGKTQMPTGLLAYFTHGYTYVVQLSAEGCREHYLTAEQLEALVQHELSHTGDADDGIVGEDGLPDPIIVEHDFEGFGREIERYGFWHRGAKRIETAGAKRMQALARQLSLPDAQPANGAAQAAGDPLRLAYPAEAG